MIKKTVLLYTFLSFYLTVFGQGTDESFIHLTHSVDSILQKEVDENRIPGAVVMIKIGKRPAYQKAYGYAQKLEYKQIILKQPEKMTTGHLFDIASLTKVIGTTTAIMLLADQGLIQIDDPVGKYLGTFKSTDKKEITVRHLLTHTSGISEWYPMYYRAKNKEEVYKLIADLPLKYKVGSQRAYSDLGFTILGQIIDTVSGMPLETYMEEHIFLPLGMKNTVYNPLKKERIKNIAATSPGNPYEKRMVHDPALGFVFKEIDPNQWSEWRNYTLKGEVNDGNAWYANAGISGAAGLFSTAEDLQKLIDMILNKGAVGDKQFISDKTLKEFLTPDAFNNGLGWMMDPENSFMKNGPAGTFGHTGFTGTSIAVIPDHTISVIILINRQNMGLLQSGNYYNVNPIRSAVFNAVQKCVTK
jgi:CubicO group peptidase (beta-lactamase class C family)